MTGTTQQKKKASQPAAEAEAAPTDAQRRAAVILEVLAGVRTAAEAAGVLKISTNHYYLLERKALAGLVAACQPAPRRGPPADPQRQVKQLEQQLAACRRECQRQAALVRAAQRAVGVPVTEEKEDHPASKRKRTAKAGRSAGRRRRQRQPRALRAVKSLQRSIAESEASAVQPSTSGQESERTHPVMKEQTDGSSRT